MPETTAARALDIAFDDIESVKRACAAFRELFHTLRKEVGRAIVGQDQIVLETLIALFADGHLLLEGVPGLGKTLLVRSLSDAMSLPFSRIQFTPDVMPADVTGTNVVLEDPGTGRRDFAFSKGPIFSQLLLADEINRATPKSQAALLEAMQERSVTVGGTTHHLQRPFLVMATQNPIEQEGTYPLPEAQLDRFLFKVVVPYTTRGEMNEIMSRTTRESAPRLDQVLGRDEVLRIQALAQRVVVAPHVQDYVIRLVLATHPGSIHVPPRAERYIHVGASPRGAQAIIRAAKVMAIIEGRYAIAFKDVQRIAPAALRHRIIPSFEAEADGVSTDDVIRMMMEHVPREADRLTA